MDLKFKSSAYLSEINLGDYHTVSGDIFCSLTCQRKLDVPFHATGFQIVGLRLYIALRGGTKRDAQIFFANRCIIGGMHMGYLENDK